MKLRASKISALIFGLVSFAVSLFAFSSLTATTVYAQQRVITCEIAGGVCVGNQRPQTTCAALRTVSGTGRFTYKPAQPNRCLVRGQVCCNPVWVTNPCTGNSCAPSGLNGSQCTVGPNGSFTGNRCRSSCQSGETQVKKGCNSKTASRCCARR